MPVVSNTSPLLNLAAIGEAGLLTKLFGSITAPTAVRDEIEASAS
jgi:predicted nucleic acid-binding protein